MTTCSFRAATQSTDAMRNIIFTMQGTMMKMRRAATTTTRAALARRYGYCQRQLLFRSQSSSSLELHVGSISSSLRNHSSFNVRRPQAKLLSSAFQLFPSEPSSSFSATSFPQRCSYFSTQSSSSSMEDSDDSDDETAPLFRTSTRSGVRNVAVIAHVDHGKTTLVDQLLQAAAASGNTSGSGNNDTDTTDRLLDSGELEQERGITITSKVTRLEYNAKNNDDDVMIINCVDTPGHADFCGEVDRILELVDGVILVVDAAAGPQTQTKYVLGRALQHNKTPIVVLNKCDRPNAIPQIDSGETETQLQELVQALMEQQQKSSSSASKWLDHVTLYASARQGWVTDDPLQAMELAEDEDVLSTIANSGDDLNLGMTRLLDVIVDHIPPPPVHEYPTADDKGSAKNKTDEVFSLAAVTVGSDQFLGRTCTGRIASGSIAVGQDVSVLVNNHHAGSGEANGNNESHASTNSVPSKVSGVFVYKGIHRTPFEGGRAYAGDIVTLSGVPESMAVGDTLTGSANPVPQPIPTPPLVPPTLSMDFGANNGSLAGKEGDKVASSQIRDRLIGETDNNVTLKVEPSASDSDKTVVYARGELQLGILVEQMRREGFEVVIAPPRILTSKCGDTGATLEPFEEVTVDVDAEYAGTVVSALTGDRKGVVLEMHEAGGKSRIVLEVPSRGLLGFSSEIATQTKGSAVVTHLYIEHREYAGSLGVGLSKSKLVSNAEGKATGYALSSLAARGTLFVEPGDVVYSGMVIGENAKTGPDMEVNPTKAKETTNMRTQSKEEKVVLPPPKRRSVEELIGYMADDEVIEVTPQSVRLRKSILDPSARERAARQRAKQLRSLKK